MKCDELEKFDATSNEERSAGIESRYVYNADEVDEAIEELKAEINRKEAVGKRWFERCMEARAENVRIKRALWLMTAEWAEAMGLASCNIANKFMSRENFEVGDNYRNNTVKKYRHRQVAFYKYAEYCRKKAEEYK